MGILAGARCGAVSRPPHLDCTLAGIELCLVRQYNCRTNGLRSNGPPTGLLLRCSIASSKKGTPVDAILESPLPAIVFGIFLEAILAVVFLNTRRKSVLAAMLVVLLIAAGGVALEKWWVTDREQIEATLNEIARALEANDLELVCSFIEPDAETTRILAAVNMALVTVKSAKVRNLEVQVNLLTSPPVAETRFMGNFDCEGKAVMGNMMPVPDDRYLLNFEVDFHLIDGRWMVGDNVKFEPRQL